LRLTQVEAPDRRGDSLTDTRSVRATSTRTTPRPVAGRRTRSGT
jgi:hypothetical protein